MRQAEAAAAVDLGDLVFAHQEVHAADPGVGDFAAAPPVHTWSIQDAGGEILGVQASSPGTWANAITVSLDATAKTVQVVFGTVKETHDASNAGALADSITANSQFLVNTAAPADRSKVPTTIVAGAAVSSNGEVNGGGTSVADGLAILAPETVNILVIGGIGAKDAKANMLAHLESTENDGKERMGLLGVSKDKFDSLMPDDIVSNPRVILVTPGIVATDAVSKTQVTLPAAYAAALVAGRLSTLGVHISLTNKGVPATDLAQRYTRGQQKNLLGKQMLVLRNDLGIGVLKGITTDTGAFRQISVRRTVDYAKAGVRIGANPYIGRLNNVRVRAALKATLDGFLSQMVLDEMLVGYTLDVSATRAQEIVGVALVTMTLQPTFSIDFVKVIMNLQ